MTCAYEKSLCGRKTNLVVKFVMYLYVCVVRMNETASDIDEL